MKRKAEITKDIQDAYTKDGFKPIMINKKQTAKVFHTCESRVNQHMEGYESVPVGRSIYYYISDIAEALQKKGVPV